MQLIIKSAALAMSISLLAACGVNKSNLAPQANLSISGKYLSGKGTSRTTTLGDEVVLDATYSLDPEGGTLGFKWTLLAKPEKSQFVLNSTTEKHAILHYKADAIGEYKFSLTVSDDKGNLSAPIIISIQVKNAIPVAVLDKVSITNSLDNPEIHVSAKESYDTDGDTFTYQWKIESKPETSKVTIARPNADVLDFIPDVSGVYTISMTVSDGKESSSKRLTLRTLDKIIQALLLDFIPTLNVYSQSLDTLISVDAQRNQLKIIDPISKKITSLQMPDKILSVQLSPNGKLAAVLLDGHIHLVNLETAQVIKKQNTGDHHTDVFTTDAEIAYVVGKINGQWLDTATTRINMNTGELTRFATNLAGDFYSEQQGVYADRLNKVFLAASRSGRAKISYFGIGANSDVVDIGGFSSTSESDAINKLWLSSHQDLLFTNLGKYFYTNSLQYAGQLKTKNILQMSSSLNNNELMVTSYIPKTPYDYSANLIKSLSNYYTVLSGSNFNDEKILEFPQVQGEKSYGIATYYSSRNKLVQLIQIGSDQQDTDNILHLVMVR